MLRTRTSPGPGSGTGVSSILKFSGVGMPVGRAASTIWRVTVMVTDVSSDDGGHAAVEVDGSAGDVRAAPGQPRARVQSTIHRLRPPEPGGLVPMSAPSAIGRSLARSARSGEGLGP